VIESPGGYNVLPAAPTRPTTYVTRRAPRSSVTRTKSWLGLVRPPKEPESRLRDSLLYPLWDTPGVSLLIFLPVALWAASLPVFGLIPVMVRGLALIAVMAPFALPMVFVFGLVLGFMLLCLGRILVSSARGEVDHPRLPSWDYASILSGLGRWLWSGLVGFALGGLPALVYWMNCGDIDLFDRVVFAELLALGAAYSQMALIASLLHEDFRAANPITVIQAIRRVGWSYVRPCLMTGAAVVLALGAFALAYNAPDPLLAVLGLWLFWVFLLYEAMVVLRVLGLFYRRHAAALGWFPDRPRWGA